MLQWANFYVNLNTIDNPLSFLARNENNSRKQFNYLKPLDRAFKKCKKKIFMILTSLYCSMKNVTAFFWRKGKKTRYTVLKIWLHEVVKQYFRFFLINTKKRENIPCKIC